MTINELVKQSHKIAVDHGWHETERNTGEMVALMHSELSEALEEYRNMPFFKHGVVTKDDLRTVRYEVERGGITLQVGQRLGPDPDDVVRGPGKPCGFGVELADCIIRIADLCGMLDIDLESIIEEKMKYNETRPYRHGNKLI